MNCDIYLAGPPDPIAMLPVAYGCEEDNMRDMQEGNLVRWYYTSNFNDRHSRHGSRWIRSTVIGKKVSPPYAFPLTKVTSSMERSPKLRPRHTSRNRDFVTLLLFPPSQFKVHSLSHTHSLSVSPSFRVLPRSLESRLLPFDLRTGLIGRVSSSRCALLLCFNFSGSQPELSQAARADFFFPTTFLGPADSPRHE